MVGADLRYHVHNNYRLAYYSSIIRGSSSIYIRMDQLDVSYPNNLLPWNLPVVYHLYGVEIGADHYNMPHSSWYLAMKKREINLPLADTDCFLGRPISIDDYETNNS